MSNESQVRLADQNFVGQSTLLTSQVVLIIYFLSKTMRRSAQKSPVRVHANASASVDDAWSNTRSSIAMESIPTPDPALTPAPTPAPRSARRDRVPGVQPFVP